MPKPKLIEVKIVALIPTSAGCAVFFGNDDKVSVFYIEPAIGASINAAMRNLLPPRPLTHDLMCQMLNGFGAKITRIVITQVNEEIFYAHLVIEAENEIMERKIIEFDSRPSDCMALAVRTKTPIHIVEKVWDQLPSKGDLLTELQGQSFGQEEI